jgi:drug/metabolite transporter (DMT)-like permease
LRATPAHALLFAVVLSTVSVMTQLAFAAGSNALTVVLVRNGVGTLAIALFLLFTRAPLGLQPRERHIALAIGLILGFNNITLNMAIERVPVPVAILAFYTYPVWMALWSWMRGHERFRPVGAVGVLLAFAGLTLTLGVGPVMPDPVGVALALISALAWVAVLQLSTHYLAAAPSHARSLHMFISATIVITLSLFAFGTPTMPSGAPGLTALALVPLAYGAGMLGMLWVTAGLGPMRTSFYMNFEPIVSIALSALVLGQTLTALQLVGAALVVVSLVIFRPPPKTPAQPAAT